MVRSFTSGVRCLLFISLLQICLYACAENKGIGVTLLNYTVDSANSVDIGYTITINAQVTNFDTGVFSGVIDFGLRSNSEILTNTGIFAQPPYSGDSVKLQGGETVPAIFSVNVNYQYFAPGPDVVVVWPICTRPIADSIVINVTVLDPAGINTIAGNVFTYSVLNDRILFQNLKVNFQQVRIYDILGQQLFQLNGENINLVQLPVLPKGIYLCRLISAGGQSKTFQFFH